MAAISGSGLSARDAPPRSSAVFGGQRLRDAATAAAPAVLFGLRLWASVCLALYVAFWLELDNAFWAGTTAAIVCQPHLGASLRKGWYRMIGTVVGAVAIVVLTACFPQDRAAFLVSLALWGAASALLATILRNFAAYGAALAGYTAAIIASDQLGATGGVNGLAFTLAVARASEICIGIVCAGIILLLTDLGGASRRLASLFASVSAEIAGRFIGSLSLTGLDLSETQAARRELVRQVTALDPVIDEALGESSRLRYHSPVLQAAVDGLFAAWLAGARWRFTSPGCRMTKRGRGRMRCCKGCLRSCATRRCKAGRAVGWPIPSSCAGCAKRWCGRWSPSRPARRHCDWSPTRRLRFSSAYRRRSTGWRCLSTIPLDRVPRRGGVRLRVPDWLPALVNALRTFLTIGAVMLFWIVTAWPDGATAITFAAIGVILFAARADHAYDIAIGFMLGSILTVAVAATVKFAVLPNVQTYVGFSLVIGLVLVPVGAFLALQWQPAIFTGVVTAFVPLLAPANPMTYDTQQFYNSAVAIIAGVGAAALSFRLLPPVSPALRTRRLLALTLRDLRRLAIGPIPGTPDDWQGRIYGRLTVLPDAADGLQRSQLVAALLVGTEIIRLCRIVHRFGMGAMLDTALEAVAQGNNAMATGRLARLDQALAARSGAGTGAPAALRARGSILAISEALTQHAAYFGAGAAGVRFAEINLFGVYVAPISLMMVAAWLIVIGLRRFAAHFGLLRYVWHPALFVFGVYMIVLSSIVLLFAR